MNGFAALPHNAAITPCAKSIISGRDCARLARAKPYVSYFPQGRMDLADALARGAIPVTEALADIAESCNLCGVCDLQCHFYTGLRPLAVMATLKNAVEHYVDSGGELARAP